MLNTVLIDLDGTLIDHFTVLFRCYEHTLTRLGYPFPLQEPSNAVLVDRWRSL